jgi:hypothetical protein
VALAVNQGCTRPWHNARFIFDEDAECGTASLSERLDHSPGDRRLPLELLVKRFSYFKIEIGAHRKKKKLRVM